MISRSAWEVDSPALSVCFSASVLLSLSASLLSWLLSEAEVSGTVWAGGT